MLKVYRITRSTASVIVYKGGVPTRIEFNGAVFHNNYHGQFVTDDADIQKAIEQDSRFGSEIYLAKTYGEPEVEEVKPVIVPQNTEAKTMNFAQAKEFLIAQGVSPDNLTNFLKVKSEAKKFDIELVK